LKPALAGKIRKRVVFTDKEAYQVKDSPRVFCYFCRHKSMKRFGSLEKNTVLSAQKRNKLYLISIKIIIKEQLKNTSSCEPVFFINNRS
jgi:hypothetical protein